VVNKIVTIMT